MKYFQRIIIWLLQLLIATINLALDELETFLAREMKLEKNKKSLLLDDVATINLAQDPSQGPSMDSSNDDHSRSSQRPNFLNKISHFAVNNG